MIKCVRGVVFWCFLSVPVLAVGNDCNLIDLMSSEEREQTGVQQLSESQQSALQAWFDRYCSNKNSEVASSGLDPQKPIDDEVNSVGAVASVGAVVDNNRLKIASEEAFGLEQMVENEVESLVSTIKKITRNPYGRFLVTLDNGQKWRQRETKKMKLKVGDSVKISHAVLGSYDLKLLPDGKRTKVRRVK